MELVAPCLEGYHDHDQNPATECVPLWAPPILEGERAFEVWVGEPITLRLQARSEDPTPLRFSWSQPVGQNLTFTSAEGDVTCTPTGTHRATLSLTLTATDTLGQTTRAVVTLTLLEPIGYAVESGDPSFIPDELSLLERIIQEAERLEIQQRTTLDAIWGEEAISYDPTRDSQFFTARGLSAVTPLILGNEGTLLAAAYERGDTRALAFGSNWLAEVYDGRFTAQREVTRRALAWLSDLDLTAAEPPTPRSIKLIGLNADSSVSSAALLRALFPEWTTEICAWERLVECAESADLIIWGARDAPDPATLAAELLVSTLQSALDRGTPLLYVHQHSWNSDPMASTLLGLIGLTIQSPGGPGNFYIRDRAEWASAAEMSANMSDLGRIKALAESFRDSTMNLDLSVCEGRCDNSPEYLERFGYAALLVRELNQAVERSGVALFDTPNETLHKLLVLLGDLWRARAQFPMDKTTTPSATFLKAYYADHAALSRRAFNPAPADLGDFSRVDFTHITPEAVTERYLSKRPFRAARVYALPGQTFTVTWSAPDPELPPPPSSPLTASIQINSLRNTSVHEFDARGYTRPKFVTSEAIPLTRGEPLTLTSPYGGPIQVRFSENDVEVELSFSGVGRHPVWRSAEDDATFSAALTTGDYDWVEVITPHFEIHSTLSKIRETFESPLASSGSELAELIVTYHHGYALALAGYRGPAIPDIEEITDFVTSRGWPLPERDLVQHFNADKPTCGYGCSGNPYDAGWSFSPLGHGDLHEVGHNHERGRFKPDNREGHATTNYYAYFPKQQHYIDTGVEPECQSLPFTSLFDKLQNAQLAPDSFSAMHEDATLNGWSQGASFMIQALMIAERRGVVERGWHVIGRLHAHERAFNNARADNAAWSEARLGLGFGGMTRAEANSISNNDYLVAALSVVTELNYSAYYGLWGLEISAALEWSILSLGFPEVELVYYAAQPTDACALWDAREIEIDGESLWIDLSDFERTSVDLSETYISAPYTSEESSVYFVTLESEVGPNERVWWGADDDLTELYAPVIAEGAPEDAARQTLVIDAYQQRCNSLITLNAGRVGGCEHRLVLSVDPAKNEQLDRDTRYLTPEALPLLLRAWRWHAPHTLIDTLAFDISYTRP